MLKGIQIVGIFVSSILILISIYQVKKGSLSKTAFGIWVIFWGSISGIFFYPSFMVVIADMLNATDVMQTGIVISLMVLFLMIYYLYWKISKLDTKLSLIIQNMAIHDYMTEATKKDESE